MITRLCLLHCKVSVKILLTMQTVKILLTMQTVMILLTMQSMMILLTMQTVMILLTMQSVNILLTMQPKFTLFCSIHQLLLLNPCLAILANIGKLKFAVSLL